MSSKTEATGFTLQVHYNRGPISLLPAANFGTRMRRQRFCDQTLVHYELGTRTGCAQNPDPAHPSDTRFCLIGKIKSLLTTENMKKCIFTNWPRWTIFSHNCPHQHVGFIKLMGPEGTPDSMRCNWTQCRSWASSMRRHLEEQLISAKKGQDQSGNLTRRNEELPSVALQQLRMHLISSL